MREIGSEFWPKSNIVSECRTASANRLYLLSGRTALDYICKDSHIRSIMLPSYCCDSMIEPFIRNNVAVRFYTARENLVSYDFANDCDAVLLIDYFGYILAEMIEIANVEHNQGKVVIYDGTHLLTGNPYISEFSDYNLCSHRKWAYCNFATLEKKCGAFTVEDINKENAKYMRIRDRAAKQKADYIRGILKDKTTFLEMFSQAEEVLERDYVGYVGIPTRLDYDTISKQRKINASILIKGLSAISRIRLMRTHIGPLDVPMFVPILLEKMETRTQLRKYLIENDIYCPVHWPLSKFHAIDEGDKEIYYQELSLVCDQRYNAEDMQRQIEVIQSFFEERAL